MSVSKIRTGEDVLSAAIHRIEWLFNTFSSVCLSFSGGKDSTVLFHLAADVARRKKRRFSVLFIDWEAQYQCTIEHIQKMREMYRDVTDTFYWVALPLTTVNGVSQFQPEWICAGNLAWTGFASHRKRLLRMWRIFPFTGTP